MKRFVSFGKFFITIPFLLLPNFSHSEEALFPSEELGIPLHKELKDLCRGNVLSENGKEIVWHVFTSRQPFQEIIKDYQHKLGKEGSEEKGLGWIWRFEKESSSSVSNSSEIVRVLFIMSIAGYKPNSSCDKKPPSQTLSLVEFSNLYKRSKK
jgi:hypothetical protein